LKKREESRSGPKKIKNIIRPRMVRIEASESAILRNRSNKPNNAVAISIRLLIKKIRRRKGNMLKAIRNIKTGNRNAANLKTIKKKFRTLSIH